MDTHGQTIDFLLTAQRDEKAAKRFLTKAIRNNIIEQAHRGVKRITRPMLGFKASQAAQGTLAGIELMPMLRKGQLAGGVEQGLRAADQFYSLAASSLQRQSRLTSPRSHAKICDKTLLSTTTSQAYYYAATTGDACVETLPLMTLEAYPYHLSIRTGVVGHSTRMGQSLSDRATYDT